MEVRPDSTFLPARNKTEINPDTGVFIYEDSIVANFRNSELCRIPDGFIEQHFEPEAKIVAVSSLREEIEKLRELSPSSASTALQQQLLSGLKESIVGRYSKFHEIAIYSYGYGDEQTMTLAHK